MADKKHKRKVKTYDVIADDFLVEAEDGEQFAPHAGQSVTLLRELPWRVMQAGPDMTWRDFTDMVVKTIKRQVTAWTFVDDDGEPFPAPGTPEYTEFLWDMDNDLRFWIWGKIRDRSSLPNE